MIKVEKIEVWGFEHAIRGMRNPMNSWNKSDSVFCDPEGCGVCEYDCSKNNGVHWDDPDADFCVGDNDMDLMKRLTKAGTEHRKFARQIMISMDITAPMYWWKEFDTYKIGTTANSCSTMHKIHSKEFTMDDFSFEHCQSDGIMCQTMDTVLWTLNCAREQYLETKNKTYWWDMIQLLPSSYNQRRTVTMNYENAINMIYQRQNHKLDEWIEFTDELTSLPYMVQLIGE